MGSMFSFYSPTMTYIIIVYLIVFFIKCLGMSSKEEDYRVERVDKDRDRYERHEKSIQQVKNRKQWLENEIQILQDELYSIDPHVSMREIIREEIRNQLASK